MAKPLPAFHFSSWGNDERSFDCRRRGVHTERGADLGGIREYFNEPDEPGAAMDFVLYSNYGRLVTSLIAGHIDIAWNTNLAYVRTVMQTNGHCTALAQRDSDVGFTTIFVARSGSGLTGPVAIAGKRLALGSADSAHAAILPLYYLARAGVP
jgi:ABC-type phosphate/phosphonate transport system substrate-binding protein